MTKFIITTLLTKLFDMLKLTYICNIFFYKSYKLNYKKYKSLKYFSLFIYFYSLVLKNRCFKSMDNCCFFFLERSKND